jgi:peptide/nickel transport system substrate-binding protein
VAPIGVKLTAEALDPATQRQRRQPPGPGLAPTYDAYMGTLETHGHVDPDALYYFFHSPGPKGFGAQITGYSNPRFDALVEQASASDIPTRKPLLQQAERILAQETPVVVFWYRDGEWAYRSSAYDGWVSDFGQGLLTKRSFLPEYVKTSSVAKTGGSGGGGSSAGVWLGVAAAVVVVGALVAVGARRRRAEADAEG